MMKILSRESPSEKALERWKPALHREGYRIVPYVAERRRDAKRKIIADLRKGYRGPWLARRQTWHPTDVDRNSYCRLDIDEETYIYVPYRVSEGTLCSPDGITFSLYEPYYLDFVVYQNLEEFLDDGWKVS